MKFDERLLDTKKEAYAIFDLRLAVFNCQVAPSSRTARIEDRESKSKNLSSLAPSAAAPRCDRIADREMLKQNSHASQ
jgi:hypothetical protein